MDKLLTDHLALRPEARSIRVARRFLADAVSALGLSQDTVSVAELALSEIVTNAVVHGQPPIAVHVDADRTRLRVAVTDADPTEPSIGDRDLDGTGGRGMAIVAAVTGRWGCEADPSGVGKRVWFTVAI